MRRLLIFLVTFAIGAGLLWYFESERRADSNVRNTGAVGPDFEFDTIPGPKDPGGSPEPDDPSDGSGGDAGNEPDALVHPGEAFITRGRQSITIPDLDDEGAYATLDATDSEPLDEIGTRVRLIDVLVESFVVVDRALERLAVETRTNAASAITDASKARLRSSEGPPEYVADLFEVVIEQLRNTPLAPLIIEAPRIDARLTTRILRSVEDDLVTFRSRDVRGSGRGLDIDLASGAFVFESGAHVTVEQPGERVVTIATPDGGALRIVEVTPESSSRRTDPRIVRVTARDGVHAELQGEDKSGENADVRPIVLDAESIDVVLSFAPGDADRPTIVSALAVGEVRIRRETDVYNGHTARFTFNESGDAVAVDLEDDPSLRYRLRADDGQELEVEVSGEGPLTAKLVEDPTWVEGDPRTIGATFFGPGRVEAIDRGDVMTFERRMHTVGLEDRSEITLHVDGDVSVVTVQGDLESDAVEAEFRADEDVLRIVSEGPTRIAARDARKDMTYRVLSEDGAIARKTSYGWFVERADDVVAEAFGAEPYRVRAGSIENVDVPRRTLEASENVLYRTLWGSAFAPAALVRNTDFVELRGAEDDPVRLDLLPEDLALEFETEETAGVRTGSLVAPVLTMDEETVLAEDGVAAQFETIDGVWGIDAESLAVRRAVTGSPLIEDGGEPVPAAADLALGAEEYTVEASFVREARFDSFFSSGVFRAARLEVDLALREAGASDNDADFDRDRESQLALFGTVSATMEVYAPEKDGGPPGIDREIRERWDLAAEQAVIVRHPSIDGQPFTLAAEKVEECVYEGEGVFVEVAAANLVVEGDLGPMERDERKEPQDEGEVDLTGSSIRANGRVVLRYRPATDEPEFAGRGEVFVLEDGESGRLEADPGKRVHVTGVLPGDTLPYKMTASVVRFTRESVTAENVVIEPLTPLALADLGGVAVEKLQADSLLATETLIRFEGDVICHRVGFDEPIQVDGFLELDPEQIERTQEEGDSDGGESEEAADDRAWAPPPMPPFERGGFQDEGEPAGSAAGRRAPDDDQEQGPVRAGGEISVPLADGGLFTGQDADNLGSMLRVRDPVAHLANGVSFEAETMLVEGKALLGNPDDFVFSATSGKIEGPAESGRDWVFTFAEIGTQPVGDEMLVTVIAPEIIVNGDTARADYLAVWIDRTSWEKSGRGLTGAQPPGGPEPVAGEGETDADPPMQQPNFLAELLFELHTEDYAESIRALFMEGGVEIARNDRRAARGSRLYLNLENAAAWLEDAELVYPLSTSGEVVPLRVRTERLETDEVGALVANGATLTTCDHDVPHFVVRTNEFSLRPRGDGRWRFGASGNQLIFQQGLEVPLPSIGNLVLDEEFGVEGFENEAGEVTPLRDIGIGRTARFGTVLGAAFRFDIGRIGEWLGERIGMDTDAVRGKWDTQAQFLGSRGVLFGLGLALRERKPRDDPDEDFRLDAFVGGIPDDGVDRGTVRVPESERDEMRLWGYLRSRYPIVRGEWIDFAFASQTDAAVQPEFYENDFLRFEQRDTFVRWRKSLGADYLAMGAQKRIDDFRSQKEELPSMLAYRGERRVGTLTGAPVLWGGIFEAGYFTRREGEIDRDLFSDLPLGAQAMVGDHETARANVRQRLSMPLTTQFAGIKVTPFAEAIGTAWTSALGQGEDPARGALKGGVEVSTTLHKVTDSGFLSALAPRLSVTGDAWYEDTGGVPIPLDQTELPIDGTAYEAGLRAIWTRPATFENFDLDVNAIFRTDREDGQPDTTRIGTLAEYITRYGDGQGQIGVRHDARYDPDESETIFSRSAFAVRPNEEFVMELRYAQARAFFDNAELYETAAAVGRWRVDPKWEFETRYAHDLRNDQQLLTEVTLRRFAHDFVFDITFQDRSGEGGTNISFSLLPLLGFGRAQFGMLDR